MKYKVDKSYKIDNAPQGYSICAYSKIKRFRIKDVILEFDSFNTNNNRYLIIGKGRVSKQDFREEFINALKYNTALGALL